MKNKSTTVLLAVIFFVVWGTVGYKIYSNTASSEVELSGRLPMHFKPPELEDNEDYSLSLAYDDPFTGKVELKKKVKKKPKSNTANMQLNWPGIKYKGCIYSKRSMLAVLEINGRSSFLRRGEKHDGIKVVRVFRDSVRLEFNNEEKCFRTIGKID